MPALSAPALGFLGMAVALAQPSQPENPDQLSAPGGERTPRAWQRRAATATGGLVLLLAAAALGLPYMAVREESTASDVQSRDPATALSDLALAARFNPLSAIPGRAGGMLALQTGRFADAEQRFRQAIGRDSGSWQAWFGEGLAASALGDRAVAQHALAVAASINRQQPAIRVALAHVAKRRPLTPAQALALIVLPP